MSYESSMVISPIVVWLFTCGLLFAVWLSARSKTSLAQLGVTAALAGAALAATSATVAYGAIALAVALHAAFAARTSRIGAITLGLSAVASAIAAAALWLDVPQFAFIASMVAITLRAGLFPLHGGIAELCDRLPRVQLQQLITLPVLVFAHIRFADHLALAQTAAIPIVIVGATSMLAFAIVALAQRTLPGLLRTSTFMHGGMLIAAVGATGRGHFAAALIVSMTMALALVGFSLILESFESRVGSLDSLKRGGRARAFPRLAAALLFFGGAAVGLPGTAGFIADDLLLHALWSESVVSAVMMMVASALLAVATFASFARAFLGAPVRLLAPDLQDNERHFAILLVGLLVLLGMLPSIVVSPVSVLMSKVA